MGGITQMWSNAADSLSHGVGELGKGNIGGAVNDIGHAYTGYVAGALGAGTVKDVAKSAGVNIPGLSDPKKEYNDVAAQVQPMTNAEMAAQQYGNVQSGLAQQQQFITALQGQNGLANQNAAFQNAQNTANGVGPNPAQATLAQATGSNVSQQAALMAGQRGAGANAGLMARQASQQGANIQQNAAGQAATLQAQQQLAGQQQMATIANQQVANQGQATGAFNQYSQGAQQNILNSAANVNSTNASLANATTAANAAKYASDQSADAAKTGGLLGGLGAAAAVMLAKGGEVIGNHGPRSEMSKALSQAQHLKSGGAVPGHAAHPGNSYSNDTVKAMLSPGEVVIPRSIMQSKNPSAEAAKFVAAIMAKHGAKK